MKFKIFGFTVNITKSNDAFDEPDLINTMIDRRMVEVRIRYEDQSWGFADLNETTKRAVMTGLDQIIRDEKSRTHREGRKISAIKEARITMERTSGMLLSLRSAKDIIEYLWDMM